MNIIPIPQELLRLCYEHGGETYPDEACGVLSGPIDDVSLLTGFHPIENTLGRLHEEDPERYPRTPREGYVLDAQTYVKLDKALSMEGDKIKVIYHTHVDVGAYFSDEDKKQAVWGDEPLFPDMGYLVCGVKNGQPDNAILAFYNSLTSAFEEFSVEVLPPD